MMNRTVRNLLSAAVLLHAVTGAAATLTGTVTNRTTNKPATGDTIAVINTAQGMDEIAKATSDAKGTFHVDVPDGGQILLHITHAGAEYFKSVTPGSGTADIDVYDSAAKIDGISGEALVVRAQTDATGRTLNVTENFFVQNASTPPRTQYGGNTFDFYVPKGAQIGEAAASAPGGLPTSTKITTVDAATGHYAYTFPVRPGETRFQVEYSLPYNGRQPFAIKLGVPTDDVAVMLPKGMQFEGTAFQPINDPEVRSQSYDNHQPAFAEPVEFTIAGAGQLPQESGVATQAQGSDQGAGTPQAAGGDRPGGGLGVPVDPGGDNAPLSKYKWWIVGGLGLALATGAGIMLKNNPAATAEAGDGTGTAPPAYPTAMAELRSANGPLGATPNATSLLQTLKDELFDLESDRAAGRITPEEYAEQKAAFDVVLRRALSRIES
ncbi:MAG TPA: carboxypeptidase regulatory-like domain-containing protein [Acidobacteriaceae bacterium]